MIEFKRFDIRSSVPAKLEAEAGAPTDEIEAGFETEVEIRAEASGHLYSPPPFHPPMAPRMMQKAPPSVACPEVEAHVELQPDVEAGEGWGGRANRWWNPFETPHAIAEGSGSNSNSDSKSVGAPGGGPHSGDDASSQCCHAKAV